MDKIIELLQWVLWVIQSGVHDGNVCPSMSCDASERVIGVVRGRAPAYRCSEEGEHKTHRSYDGSHTWPNIAVNDRDRAVARVTFLLPALTDDALQAVLVVCEAAPKRDLSAATLADEQRARESATGPVERLRSTLESVHGFAPDHVFDALDQAVRDVEAQHRDVCAPCSAALGSPKDHEMRAEAVHEAVRGLGLVHMEPGSAAFKARAVLCAALGRYFGHEMETDSAPHPEIVGARASSQETRAVEDEPDGSTIAEAFERRPHEVSGALMPGEAADEAQARRRMTGPGRSRAETAAEDARLGRLT